MKLQSPRLTLVPFVDEHLVALHAHWTDPEVRRHLWDDEVISRELAAEVIAASRESFEEHGFGFWAIFLSEGTELIGFAGLRHFGEEGEIELLYSLEPEQWGRGIATEASQMVLAYASGRQGVEKVFAGADPPNVASLRVMDRLGFGDEHRRVIDGVETVYRSMAFGREGARSD